VSDPQPHPIDLARELREVLGLPSGALPITPKAAWDEAIEHVRQLTLGHCHACVLRETDGESSATQSPQPRHRGLTNP
jgi:hypothetical protein